MKTYLYPILKQLIIPYFIGKDARRLNQYHPFNLDHHIDEVVRAVRWHRSALAFAVGKTESYADTLMLVDTWHFNEGYSWMTWLWGKEVKQVAPARVSRNMPLPEVICDGPKPLCHLQ